MFLDTVMGARGAVSLLQGGCPVATGVNFSIVIHVPFADLTVVIYFAFIDLSVVIHVLSLY